MHIQYFVGYDAWNLYVNEPYIDQVMPSTLANKTVSLLDEYIDIVCKNFKAAKDADV